MYSSALYYAKSVFALFLFLPYFGNVLPKQQQKKK